MFIQQVLNGLIIGSLYALIALGMTMIYGILKVLHFAHGAVYMLGGYGALLFYIYMGVPLPLAIAIAMAFCALLGVGMEIIAYRPLRLSSRLSPLIAGIAVYYILEDVVRHIWGPFARPLEIAMRTEVYRLGSVLLTNVQLMLLGLTFLLIFLLHLIISRTKAGMAMQAVSQDSDMAAIQGVNINRIISLNFAIGSAMAAMAGVLVAIYFHEVFPSMGEKAIEKGFAIVVLGGMGSVPGSIIAGVVLGIAESLLIGYFDIPLARDAMAFILLIIILLVRPYGILGEQAGS